MFTVWQPLCKAMFSFSLTVGYRNAGHDTFFFFIKVCFIQLVLAMYRKLAII